MYLRIGELELVINNIKYLKFSEFKRSVKDNTLLKIAFITGLVGLIALYFATEYSDDFSEGRLFSEDLVIIKGILKDIRHAKGSIILDIQENKDIKAILSNAHNINLSTGKEVEIIGKKDGSLIIVEKIRIIK